MLTLLFWNLKEKPLADRVAGLVRRHGVDLVVLAECENPAAVATGLNQSEPPSRFLVVETGSRVTVLTNSPADRLQPVDRSAYFSVMSLRAIRGLRPPLLIAAAHLPSKRETSPTTQFDDARQLATVLAATEDRVGHRNSLVIGDLNANPFELGVAGALHGVMTRGLASGETRLIHGVPHRFLYNPMWRFFGDGTPGPPGTYFYRKADHECYFWNVYDQVLLRPALLPYFPSDGVKILENDGVDTLLARSGTPDVRRGSDHLPILVRLAI